MKKLVTSHRHPVTIYFDLVTGQFYPTADAKHPFRITHDPGVNRATTCNLDFFALSQFIDRSQSLLPTDEALLRALIEKSPLPARHFPEGWRQDRKHVAVPQSDIEVDLS